MSIYKMKSVYRCEDCWAEWSFDEPSACMVEVHEKEYGHHVFIANQEIKDKGE